MFLEEVIEETLKDYSTADLSDFTVRLEIAEIEKELEKIWWLTK